MSHAKICAVPIDGSCSASACQCWCHYVPRTPRSEQSPKCGACGKPVENVGWWRHALTADYFGACHWGRPTPIAKREARA